LSKTRGDWRYLDISCQVPPVSRAVTINRLLPRRAHENDRGFPHRKIRHRAGTNRSFFEISERFLLSGPRSFFALSLLIVAGVGYHRRNPQGRIHPEMHLRVRRVQLVPLAALRVQGGRARHCAGRACLLHECHPGNLPGHRNDRPGLQHRVCRCCRLCFRHEQRVPGGRQKDQRDRVRRRWRDPRYRDPVALRRLRARH